MEGQEPVFFLFTTFYKEALPSPPPKKNHTCSNSWKGFFSQDVPLLWRKSLKMPPLKNCVLLSHEWWRRLWAVWMVFLGARTFPNTDSGLGSPTSITSVSHWVIAVRLRKLMPAPGLWSVCPMMAISCPLPMTESRMAGLGQNGSMRH